MVIEASVVPAMDYFINRLINSSGADHGAPPEVALCVIRVAHSSVVVFVFSVSPETIRGLRGDGPAVLRTAVRRKESQFLFIQQLKIFRCRFHHLVSAQLV